VSEVHHVGVAALLALQFVTLCVVTRRARGWRMTIGGFALYAAANGAFLWGCRTAGFTPLGTIQLGCSVLWVPLVALTLVLSRDNRWRTLFVALDYVAYATAILPISHALAFRKVSVFGGGGGFCSLIFLVVAHAVFLFVLLPLVPRSNERLHWRIGCLVAFLLFILLYATGVWPHSLVTGGWQEWTAFLMASAVAWVVFPMVYTGMRSFLRNRSIERNLALMTSEVATRRTVIDAARRQRHDLRHHRITLAEYLLRGQVDKALGYLEQLDTAAERTPTDKLIWCENDTLNAILSGYARRAAAKGVAFEVTANVERTVNLPDIDVVAVVANLVENAIDAAGKLGVENRCRCREVGESDSAVTVALRQRERTVGMTVTNPVPEGFTLSAGLPCKEPGVGIESVQRVIERHHGELAFALKDGILECQAMLRTDSAIIRDGEGAVATQKPQFLATDYPHPLTDPDGRRHIAFGGIIWHNSTMVEVKPEPTIRKQSGETSCH